MSINLQALIAVSLTVELAHRTL